MTRRYLIISSGFGGNLDAASMAENIETALRKHVVCGEDREKVLVEKVLLDDAAADYGVIPDLERKISGCDIVIAAEKNLDDLSLGWRFLGGVAGICKKQGKPLDVICSTCALDPKLSKRAGITNIFPLSDLGPSVQMNSSWLLVAGCDEAGRGCLAGPVFAAAVILPEGFYHPLLNDSKQLTADQRLMMRAIIEREALAWKVVAVSAEEIDEMNILNASIEGMRRALDALGRRPHAILVDGNKFKPYTTPSGQPVHHHCIVQGDGRCAAIAAASILAKTHRDEFMTNLARKYPQYGWERNFAYPTPDHKAAIKEFGITPYHRKSYKLDY